MSDGEVPADHALRGFHGVGLLLRDAAPTGAILSDVFGFSEAGREGTTIRFQAKDASLGGIVDIRAAGDFLKGRQGAGSVHHIAFRAADDEAEFAMRDRLADNHGIRTTDQKTATTSARFISASRAGCCSRSPPTFLASPPTSRSRPLVRP